MQRYTRTDQFYDAVGQHLPMVLGGVTSLVSGAFMLFDDVADFGDFASEKHPSPIHHWQIGVLFILLGVFLLCLALVMVVFTLLKVPIPSAPV